MSRGRRLVSAALHPLPLLSRSLISIAVLVPWIAGVALLAEGLVAPGSWGNRAFAVSVLLGVCASLACLVLVLTDPELRGRRGRWIAGFVLASGIAPLVYLWSWQWRRPAAQATVSR